MRCKISSAVCLNLDQSKILLSGSVLKVMWPSCISQLMVVINLSDLKYILSLLMSITTKCSKFLHNKMIHMDDTDNAWLINTTKTHHRFIPTQSRRHLLQTTPRPSKTKKVIKVKQK